MVRLVSVCQTSQCVPCRGVRANRSDCNDLGVRISPESPAIHLRAVRNFARGNSLETTITEVGAQPMRGTPRGLSSKQADFEASARNSGIARN